MVHAYNRQSSPEEKKERDSFVYTDMGRRLRYIVKLKKQVSRQCVQYAIMNYLSDDKIDRFACIGVATSEWT